MARFKRQKIRWLAQWANRRYLPWIVLVVVFVILLAVALVGSYAFGWTWTGFKKKGSLWDWLNLLILPVVVTILPLWFATYRKWPVRWIILLVVALVTLAVLAVGGYTLNWTWTGFEGNTFWDWLNLLLVPCILPVIIAWLKGQQSEDSGRSDRQQQRNGLQEADHQQEAVLEAYLNHISELLLDRHLGESQLKSDVREIARARTLTTLRRVGKKDKGDLLHFLYQTNLICKGKVIIDLREADLRWANLSEAILSEANLSEADLSEADLSGAELSGANLSETKLNRASLNRANLSEANLHGANLSEARLNETNLSRSDLSDSKLNGSDLSKADLSNTRLNGSSLSKADLSDTRLNGSSTINADLRWARLNGADLSKARLSGADLREANLSEARLIWADLRGANLSGAALKGANLNGANLSGATYTKEQLSEAKSLNNIIQ